MRFPEDNMPLGIVDRVPWCPWLKVVMFRWKVL